MRRVRGSCASCLRVIQHQHVKDCVFSNHVFIINLHTSYIFQINIEFLHSVKVPSFMCSEYHVHTIFCAVDRLYLVYQVLSIGRAVMVVFVGCNVLFICNLKVSSGLSSVN